MYNDLEFVLSNSLTMAFNPNPKIQIKQIVEIKGETNVTTLLQKDELEFQCTFERTKDVLVPAEDYDEPTVFLMKSIDAPDGMELEAEGWYEGNENAGYEMVAFTDVTETEE